MRVFVADDSASVREKVIRLLSGIDNIKIAGEAGKIQEVIASVRMLKPEILILDVGMCRGHVLDALATIKNSHPSLMVLVMTNEVSGQLKEACLHAGAGYFLDKSHEFQQLKDIVGSADGSDGGAANPENTDAPQVH